MALGVHHLCSMSAVRRFLSISTVALATLAMAGCYDLSAPSGPRRDDFVRENNPTQTQEQGQTSAAPACDPAACKAVKDVNPETGDDGDDAADRDDLRANEVDDETLAAARNDLRLLPGHAD